MNTTPLDKPGTSCPSTRILVTLARDGDRGARAAILERYDPHLRSLVHRHLGPGSSAAEADDLLQTIRLSIIRSLPSVRCLEPAAFSTWLRRLVQCRLADWDRARFRRRDRGIGPPASLDDTRALDVASQEPTPSRIFMGQEEVQSLRRAIETVPERYRGVLRLLCEKDPGPAEMAGYLGKPPEAARKFVARALEHLRRALGPRLRTSGRGVD